jgi:hypothetical protein
VGLRPTTAIHQLYLIPAFGRKRLDAAIGLLEQTTGPATAGLDTADWTRRPAQNRVDSVQKFGDVVETGPRRKNDQ